VGSKCGASIVRVDATVVFGKVALKVATVVEDAGDLDHTIFAAAIEKKMPND
jgi:hypothetical protein